MIALDKDQLQKALVPAVTAAVTAAALLYNVGFFSAVGLDFVNLFSLAEHLIFALTGVALAVMVALFGLVTMLLIKAATRSQSHLERPVVVLAFAILAIATIAQFLLRGNSWSRDWAPLAAYLLVLVGLSGAYFAWMNAEARLRVLPAFGIGSIYFFGLVTGFASISLGPPDTTLQSGEQVILVRFGQSFSLISQGDYVVAIPSSMIVRVAQR